jgi:alanine dehydrogenase
VAPGRVLVIGGGIVGYNAAVIALGLGANVTILERSIDRMRHLDEILSGRVSLVMSSTLQIEESVREADVVIGAVLIPGALAPKLLTREMIAGMKTGSVFCDVAIDQGGCAETSRRRPTTISLRRRRRHPLRREYARCGADHVDHGADERYAALRREIAEYGLALAVARDKPLARGVNVIDGRITYEAVAEAHGLEYMPLRTCSAPRGRSSASPNWRRLVRLSSGFQLLLGFRGLSLSTGQVTASVCEPDDEDDVEGRPINPRTCLAHAVE